MATPPQTPAAAFQSESIPTRVSWTLDNLPPAAEIYITRDDVLVVNVVSALAAEAVTVNARLLTVDGVIVPIQQTFSPSGAFTSQLFTIPLSEGFLLSLTATAGVATVRGQTFVRAWLNRGQSTIGNAMLLLMAAYVTGRVSACWPAMTPAQSTDGQGNLRVLQIGNPAAGADWDMGAVGHQRVRIQSIQAQLVTSVAVANRQVTIKMNDNAGNVFFTGVANAAIAASTTAQVIACPGALPSTLIAADVFIALPSLPVLGTSDHIASVTVNIQAGDQWSNVRIGVEEWFDGL